MPRRGCQDGEWVEESSARPLYTLLYTELLTGRSDIFLTNASVNLRREPYVAKAAVFCAEGGGYGDMTLFSFQISDGKSTRLTVSGPGANVERDGVLLGLKPGEIHPVGVEVRVEGALVVDWSSDLVFQVGGEQHRVNIGSASTAGADSKVPRFTSEGGKWRRG